jgi:DNA-binding transcriptional MocR family regulator
MDVIGLASRGAGHLEAAAMSGTHVPPIELERSAAEPLYLQVSGRIRELVAAEVLTAGERLPSERDLATALGVSRSTIVAAYAELAADGLVERHVGRGTTILDAPPSGEWSWAGRLPSSSASALAHILEGFKHRTRIGLEIADPATELLPVAELREIAARVMSEEGADAFGYVPADGLPALHEVIARRYDLDAGAHAVLITSGAMQGMDLVVRALIAPGDDVIVETPSYPGALDALRRAGARLIPVPVDRDGIRTDLLAGVLARAMPRHVLVVTRHQNPSGAVLSDERREALLAMTRQHGVPVLENMVNAELSFDASTFPPLLAGRGAEHAILVSSLSKVLSGGVRVGWIAGSPALIDAVLPIKQHADVNTSGFLQHLALRCLESGLIDRHLERVRPAYAARCETLARALRRHCGVGLRFDLPRGGLSLWLGLDPHESAEKFARLASVHGVSVVPGGAFAVDSEQAHRLRVSFGSRTDEELEEAARRLGIALAEFREQTLPRRVPRRVS